MQKIDGKTTLMGLLGKDISYTLSPQIHNAALAKFGINSVYLPFSLESGQVQTFLDLAWQMGAMGFNVTKPHKELVAALFPECGLASVNTLRRGLHGWEAFSTDGEGFSRGVERMGQPLMAYDNFVILGDGGASQAIVSYLVKEISLLESERGRLYKIKIFSRKLEKIRNENSFFGRLAAQSAFGDVDPMVDFKPFQVDALKETLDRLNDRTLLVQATSAPQYGDRLDSFVPAINSFRGAVVDLLYEKPSQIYFAAMARDIPAQDGEPMLVEQARLSQELWWGKSLTYDTMKMALKRL